MHDDIHLPLATGSAVAIYGWTLESIVLVLWAIYVLILIAIKMPDLIAKYPIVSRIWKAIWKRR